MGKKAKPLIAIFVLLGSLFVPINPASGNSAQTSLAPRPSSDFAGKINPGAGESFSGPVQLGVPLTFTPGSWSNVTIERYNWTRFEFNISGQTSLTYTPREKDAGARIGIRVYYTYLNSLRKQISTSELFLADGQFDCTPIPIPPFTERLDRNSIVVEFSGDLPADAPFISDSFGIQVMLGVGSERVQDSGLGSIWHVMRKRDPSQIGSRTFRFLYDSTGNGVESQFRVTIMKGMDPPGAQETNCGSTSLGQIHLTGIIPNGEISVAGVQSVGETLSVTKPVWINGSTESFQWKRNGTPIPGANSATYKLQAADSGTIISVAVTGAKAGWTSRTRETIGLGPISPKNSVIGPTPIAAPTIAPTPTVTPTPAIQPTIRPTIAPNTGPTPTIRPTIAPTPTVTPTVTPAPTSSNLSRIIASPSKVTSVTLKALPASDVSMIPPATLARIPSSTIAALNPNQAVELSAAQLNRLPVSSLQRLAARLIQSLSLPALTGMTAKQLSKLTAKQKKALLPEQVMNLTPAQQKAVGRK